jgi:hypothetical protein
VTLCRRCFKIYGCKIHGACLSREPGAAKPQPKKIFFAPAPAE